MSNKFNFAWQLVRTQARNIKDPEEKVNFVIDYLEASPNMHNASRVLNWLKMTKIGYKKPHKIFDEMIEYIETHTHKYSSSKDNEAPLGKASLEDLEMVYNDLKKRTYGFQFEEPRAHTEFVKELEDEIKKRR